MKNLVVEDRFKTAKAQNKTVYLAKVHLRKEQSNLKWEEKVALVEQMNKDLAKFKQ